MGQCDNRSTREGRVVEEVYNTEANVILRWDTEEDGDKYLQHDVAYSILSMCLTARY